MTKNALMMTQDGHDKLQAELEELIAVRRPEVTENIKKARSFGDLSENALYDQARADQAFVEGRIAELEDILGKAEIVAEPVSNGEVALGSQVKVHIDGDEESFTIVGEPEADPSNAKISHTSPLGQALIGKKVGDEVEVEAPVGQITYRIMNVE